MDSMSEQWWEKKLNIRTAGKVDHYIEEACNPYEPTDYCILEALADSGYISSDSHVLYLPMFLPSWHDGSRRGRTRACKAASLPDL